MTPRPDPLAWHRKRLANLMVDLEAELGVEGAREVNQKLAEALMELERKSK
jgi:hypothetical protein